MIARDNRAPQPGESRAGRNPTGDRLLVVVVFLAGLMVAVLLHLPALVEFGVYKEDVLQSPHWAAYHSTSFRADDLILRYASFNESPLQNAIYWTATWFIEFMALTKILGVLSYGLLSAIFFVIGRAMYGRRFGLLLALFITAFPDQWDYSAGFFSKFWAIPLLLICVFILHKNRPGGLIGLLPFGAIAYPTAAVLIGMTASVYCVLEWFHDRERAWKLFRCLAIGSALALAILMVKYISPPEGIGDMRSGSELRSMPEVRWGGYPSHYLPTPPLAEELADQFAHPFVLLSAVLFFLTLGRRGIPWERSWTALFLASAIGYVVADLFFMKFYIPSRYLRYSMAVLLALWSARNWDLILAGVRSRAAQVALAAGLVLGGLYFYSESYAEGRGWSDRRALVPVSRFVREQLPDGILVAGSPKFLDDVMIQGRRSVLCPYKLAHPWFTDYYDEIRERTRATLRAHFAATSAPLNQLHRFYGVTHFLVEKKLLDLAAEDRTLFAAPYSDEIYEELGDRREFFLASPSPGLFIWEDDRFAILELPIRDGQRFE